MVVVIHRVLGLQKSNLIPRLVQHREHLFPRIVTVKLHDPATAGVVDNSRGALQHLDLGALDVNLDSSRFDPAVPIVKAKERDAHTLAATLDLSHNVTAHAG